MKRKQDKQDPPTAVLYAGQIPLSITSESYGDGWFPASTLGHPDVQEGLVDGTLSIKGSERRGTP